MLKEVKCQYCKEDYYAIESYVQYAACPDCFERYYIININGSVYERDEEFTGNDTSYKKELKLAYQPGAGRPKGADEDWGNGVIETAEEKIEDEPEKVEIKEEPKKSKSTQTTLM